MKENNYGNEDLLSNVPIDLIFKIIACLSYASAATTPLLSHFWYALWDKVLVQHGTIDDLLIALQSFLQHIDDCSPQTHPWKFLYKFSSKNVVIATVLGNFQLRLDFSKFNGKSKSLFHLSLQPGNIDLLKLPTSPKNSTFYVKILHLTAVNYSTMASVVSSLATNFHFLESLCVEECKGLHSLRVFGQELKKLSISKCYELSFLHLNTPKLEVFHLKGYRPWIMGKGLEYKLKDVMLDFRRGARSKHFGSSPALLLSSLMNVSCATLCRSSYQEIITSNLYANQEKYTFHHLKELWWIDNEVNKQTTRMLISFLSLSCPSLEKLFITMDPKNCSFQRMVKGNATFSTSITRLSNLKIVKVEGCKNEMEENLLVEAFSGVPVIISKLQNEKFPRLLRGNPCEFVNSEYSKTQFVINHVQVDQLGLLQVQHPHMKM